MGNYELKEGQGSCFKNDYKKDDKHPDFKGTVLIDGKERDIAMWTKQGAKGLFYSIKVSDKFEKKEERFEPIQKEIRKDDSDTNLPF